jgi:hypothetical protein
MQVDQVCGCELERFAALLAGEVAELLGKGGVLGPDNSEVRNRIPETRIQNGGTEQ